MTPFALSGLLIVLTSIPLSLLVAYGHAARPVNRTFATFYGVTITVWGIGALVAGTTQDAELALRAWRLSHVGVIFIPVTYYHFACLYSGSRKPRMLLVAYLFGIVSTIFNFEILGWTYIRGVRFVFDSYYTASNGPLYIPFMCVWLWLVAESQRELWRRYQRETDTIEKARTRLVVIGTLIGFCGGSLNFLPIIGIDVYPWGNFAVPIAAISKIYGVYAYRLLDARLRITRTSILVGTYLIVLGLPFLVGWLGRGWLMAQLSDVWWLVPTGICAVLATISPILSGYLRQQAEGRILREQRRYQKTLQHAAQGMTTVRDVKRLSELIVRVVRKAIAADHASLFLWNREAVGYVLYASRGPGKLSTFSRYALDKSHPLIHWLSGNRGVLDLGKTGSVAPEPVVQEVRNLGGVLIVPGLIERRLVGFLVLGRKLSGAEYSLDDLHAFSTLANEAAMAIENAQSYGELERVNEQLKAASERLLIQERLAAAGELAAGLAHEIRNPLASIKTFAEYLPTKYKDALFRERFFRIVQAEIERIDGIVKDLLNFAKPTPLQLQPVNVSKLAQDTLTLLSDRYLKQGVHLRTAFDENGFTIEADPQQLKQVVLNLLINSLDAMPNGGMLDVATLADENGLILRVSDTGEGIPIERLHNVWDPFFTTKERGMGLGLAIVKGIVERHGGRISLSSKQGRGTVVEVRLPVAAGTDEASPEVSPAPEVSS